VNCPSDMIDQIGGWSHRSVAEAYGEGYGLNIRGDWLERIVR